MAEFKITPLKLPGLLLIEPQVFGDHRGYFKEVFRKSSYENEKLPAFVQENESLSSKGVLRGLHFQNPPRAQGKLVRCLLGAVYDVAVDIRKGSPTYGQWHGVALSAENHRMFYIPPGFAHGFCALTDGALFAYKQTEYYYPETEGAILWNDPTLNISWPMDAPKVSEKDSKAPGFDGFCSRFNYEA